MANPKQAKSAVPYLLQLAENQYVQEQLRNAVVRLRQAYTRASREGPNAAKDKKLYERIREAASSIRTAARAIEEPPPKPKRRGRKALLLAGAGAGAYALSQRRCVGAGQGGSPTRMPPSSGPVSGDGESRADETVSS
jgi:ferric-dicitrate binding protein FerR (iron transport regulator)